MDTPEPPQNPQITPNNEETVRSAIVPRQNLYHRIAKYAPKAIRVLAMKMNSKNDMVALNAAKEILSRVLPTLSSAEVKTDTAITLIKYMLYGSNDPILNREVLARNAGITALASTTSDTTALLLPQTPPLTPTTTGLNMELINPGNLTSPGTDILTTTGYTTDIPSTIDSSTTVEEQTNTTPLLDELSRTTALNEENTENKEKGSQDQEVDRSKKNPNTIRLTQSTSSHSTPLSPSTPLASTPLESGNNFLGETSKISENSSGGPIGDPSEVPSSQEVILPVPVPSEVGNFKQKILGYVIPGSAELSRLPSMEETETQRKAYDALEKEVLHKYPFPDHRDGTKAYWMNKKDKD